MNRCELCGGPAHYRYVDDVKKVHWYCSLWCANGKPEPTCHICGKHGGPYRVMGGVYTCRSCSEEEDRLWEKVMKGDCPIKGEDAHIRFCTLSRCPPGMENGHCGLTHHHKCFGCTKWNGRYDIPYETYDCFNGAGDAHCFNKAEFWNRSDRTMRCI